ncbi:MAG: hypothetical protein ACE5R6_18135 [Candidatus Heimdallarchaeota archaeon]
MAKRSILLVILAITLMLSIIHPALAGRSDPQEQGRVEYDAKENKATVGSNGYTFSFVGRGSPPFYRFSNPTNRTYLVKFMKLIEFADEDGDGKYSPKEAILRGSYSLPSADWGFTINDAAQTFTFSTPSKARSPAISLVNHYAPTQPERLKFDIQITNWAWHDATTMLALQFDVISEQDLDTATRELENGVELAGNAYFESSTIAMVNNEEDTVGITIAEKSVFLAYPHFDNLEHDPSLGFRGVPGVIGRITTTHYSYMVLIASVLLVIGVYSRRR